MDWIGKRWKLLLNNSVFVMKYPLRVIEFVELIIGERIRRVLAHCFSL